MTRTPMPSAANAPQIRLRSFVGRAIIAAAVLGSRVYERRHAERCAPHGLTRPGGRCQCATACCPISLKMAEIRVIRHGYETRRRPVVPSELANSDGVVRVASR